MTTPTLSTDDKQLGHQTPKAASTFASPSSTGQLSFPSLGAGGESAGGLAPAASATTIASAVEEDPFDYQQTVNVLTLQFLSDSEDTRVAALEWLLMLHQKAPKKVSIAILGRKSSV